MLRPQLLEIPYRDQNDLQEKLKVLLERRSVDRDLKLQALSSLTDLTDSSKVRFLFTGHLILIRRMILKLNLNGVLFP